MTQPFIAVIPARLASTRLPNKPLADLGGKPMVVRVAERAREAGAQQVLVASDAQSVLDAARDHGFEAVLTRADHPSGTDRLAEVAATFGWSDDTVVVNVQGDEPLIDPVLVRDVASHLAAHPACAIATAAHPIHDAADVFNPNVVKVALDAQSVALYFSRAPIPWSRDAYQPHWPDVAAMPAPAFPVYRHIGLYAYRAFPAHLSDIGAGADRAGRAARAAARALARRAHRSADHRVRTGSRHRHAGRSRTRAGPFSAVIK